MALTDGTDGTRCNNRFYQHFVPDGADDSTIFPDFDYATPSIKVRSSQIKNTDNQIFVLSVIVLCDLCGKRFL